MGTPGDGADDEATFQAITTTRLRLIVRAAADGSVRVVDRVR